MSRDEVIDRFLEAAGWRAAGRAALPADASFRRYVRLADGGQRALLMDAPPPMEDVRPWLAIARHLLALGLSTPKVERANEEDGLLLIEDFGEATYTRLIAGGADEAALYALAVDVLVALHRNPVSAMIELPPYDDRRFVDEALLLTDWYLPAIRGEATAESVRRDYIEAWRAVLPPARGVPDSLVLRDYHVDNLMLLDGRDGVARCGLLDFQDALIGPVSYDLVSLLQDARRDIAPTLVARMRQRYLDGMPHLDADAFDRSCAVMAAQRHAKVIGIFTRLLVRDGKPVYLPHIPRVWRLLEAAFIHPVLSPVASWFATNVPKRDRRVPDRL